MVGTAGIAGVTPGMLHPQNAYATFPGTNSKIAFVSEKDGNSEIYSLNPDGSGLKRLTNNSTSEDGAPIWSPDGSKIVFERLNNGVRAIFVMNSDGSGVKSLAAPTTSSFDPRWSPDGTKIVFAAGKAGEGIFVENPDGSGLLKLASSGQEPDWSPDSAKIAFSANNTLFVTDADGSHLAVLSGGSGAQAPVWSPDGETILFSKSDGLYKIDLAGGRSNLTSIYNENSTTFAGAPDWARSLKPVTLTVTSMDTDGNVVRGYWTVLYDGSGNVLKTGFTPANFTLNPGQQYRVGMGNFGSYSFEFWPDINGGDTSQNPRSVVIYHDTQLTAFYKKATPYPITHMSDTTATAGYGVHAPKPARAEYVTSTSQLIGDKIDSITLKLKRVGTISGTAEIGILDGNDAVKKSFGTLNVATLTTKYTDHEFHLSNNELYTIQSGDRIGIKYTGGDAGNWVSVMLDQNAADPFDGMHSYNQYYQSGKWLNHNDWDMYMVLKQTHG